MDFRVLDPLAMHNAHAYLYKESKAISFITSRLMFSGVFYNRFTNEIYINLIYSEISIHFMQ